MRLTFVVILFTLSLTSVHGTVSQGAKRLATDWSPLLWLHPEEVFYPSNPEWQIDFTELRDRNEVVLDSEPQPDTIAAGPASSSYHLNTHNPINCTNCYEPFFFGQPLSMIINQIKVKEYDDACLTTDVIYTTFYPYNYGKDVCVGLESVNHTCYGYDFHTFGNHVGDWEHAEIRFQNMRPTELYLSVHSFGAFYAFNETSNEFDFTYGEDVKGADPSLAVEYPEKVVLVEGTHPEAFVANGSHGLWGQEGKWTYINILTVHLDDYTARGFPWRIWERPQWIDMDDDPNLYNGTSLQWWNFEGKWGNIEKLDCELEPLIGECGLNGAPGGPGKWHGSFDKPPVCP